MRRSTRSDSVSPPGYDMPSCGCGMLPQHVENRFMDCRMTGLQAPSSANPAVRPATYKSPPRKHSSSTIGWLVRSAEPTPECPTYDSYGQRFVAERSLSTSRSQMAAFSLSQPLDKQFELSSSYKDARHGAKSRHDFMTIPEIFNHIFLH